MTGLPLSKGTNGQHSHAATRFRGGQQNPPILICTKSEVPNLATYRVFENLYIFNSTICPNTLPSGETVLHVDGIGVYEDLLIESAHSFANLKFQDLTEVFGNTRGAVAGYVVDLERQVARILPDPLGGAMIYRYCAHGIEMLSTSLSAITELARHLGLQLTKSSAWFAELIATESGGFGAKSSYEEIDTLPAGTYFELARNETRAVRYKMSAWDELGTTAPTADLLEQVVFEMSSNARVLAERKGPKTAHLSAGGDSRLSAAFLVSEHVSDNFNFYCAGNSVSQENIIAGEVAQHLNLRMTVDSGLRTPIVPRTAFESVAVALLGTDGMKHYAPFRSTIGSDGLILTDMYGGILRAFYSSGLEHLSRKDGRSVLSAIWNRRLHEPERGILSGAVIQKTADGLDSKLNEGRERGVAEDALGDYLYASVRQRYFGAHTLMETSRYVKQASVLYSPSALKYSLALPLPEREDGKLVYELYKSVLPEALEIRFDSEKFGQSILSDQLFPKRITYPPKEIPKTDSQLTPERADFGVTPKVSISKEHKAKARKLGLPAWRVAYEPVSRMMIKDWMRNSPETAQQVFNLENLNRLTENPCTSKADIRLVTRIASYLPWFAD